MDTDHQYTTTAHWTEDRSGLMKAEFVSAQIEFSTPPEFQGRANMWTPEHFLVAAVSSCFMATFAAIASLSKLELASLEVSTVGLLEKCETGLQFTRMTIRPVVTILREQDRERAQRLLEKADTLA